MCNHLKSLISSHELDTLKVINFKNVTGEGIIANIEDQSQNKTYSVLCGNLKLLKNNIEINYYPEILKNINYLEQEGKTVITMVINDIP